MTSALEHPIRGKQVALYGADARCVVLSRQSQTGNLTHAMLAFEFPGGWNDLKGSVAVTVLQFLLGGGGSFSAGGPG